MNRLTASIKGAVSEKNAPIAIERGAAGALLLLVRIAVLFDAHRRQPGPPRRDHDHDEKHVDQDPDAEQYEDCLHCNFLNESELAARLTAIHNCGK
jgi:hypothetical protein